VTHPQQYVQPSYPQAPPQPYGPPQGYTQAPGYPAPPQPYGPPQQQPAQLASGSLDAFYQQPSSGGGAALRFEVGTRYIGVVTRPITNADIQQQTQPGTNLPAFFKDGRPKFVMKVPLQLQPTPERPDGLGQWYVSGSARDELVRAMADAGAPAGPPQAGAIIDITCTGTRPAGVGMNPAKVYQVHYRRPDVEPPSPQAPVQQAPVQQAPVQQAAVQAQAPAQPAANLASLSPEQQALLARLTGQTAA
jgi:hypothetical protein